MTLPNIMTFARIGAVPVIVALLFVDGTRAAWAALILFVAASVTDYLDGWVARKFDQDSDLGRLFDPIADKVMVAAVLIPLTGLGTLGGVHIVAVILILARELSVTGLREFLAERDIGAPVTQLAKWKTASQMLALTLLLAAPVLPTGWFVLEAGLALLWVAAVLTVVTGWVYFQAGLAALRTVPGTSDAD